MWIKKCAETSRRCYLREFMVETPRRKAIDMKSHPRLPLCDGYILDRRSVLAHRYPTESVTGPLARRTDASAEIEIPSSLPHDPLMSLPGCLPYPRILAGLTHPTVFLWFPSPVTLAHSSKRFQWQWCLHGICSSPPSRCPLDPPRV